MPWPPRWWWLKRLSASYLLFVTCLALLYWAWTDYSHRQLAAAIAEIQARGEPVVYEDYDPPPIPADRNAAVPLNQAAVLFKPDEAWTDRLAQETRQNIKFSVQALTQPQDLAQVELLIAKHQPALRLIRDARKLDADADADWGVRVRPRMLNILVPHVNGQRDLAQFLAAAAVIKHKRGDDVEALELCRDVLNIAEHVADNAPFVPVEGADIQITIGLADLLEDLAPTLDLRNAAARAAATSLIDALLDGRRSKANHVRAAQVERTFVLDIFNGYLKPAHALTEPANRIDAARGLRQRQDEVAAAGFASYADVVARLPEYTPSWNGGPSAETPRWRASFWRQYPPRLQRQTRIVSTFFHNTRRTPEAFYRACADRRAAAALLAMRLYQLDHDGVRPSQWGDLVPAYLPAAPADPFAPGAAPMKIIRRPNDTIVYSIGKDLIDDGGAELNDRRQPVRRNRSEMIDLVYTSGPASCENAQ